MGVQTGAYNRPWSLHRRQAYFPKFPVNCLNPMECTAFEVDFRECIPQAMPHCHLKIHQCLFNLEGSENNFQGVKKPL